MTKHLEDMKNVKRDTRKGDVRSIIYIEDTPRYYSSILPLIYKETLFHTKQLIDKSLNNTQRLLHMRGRPKVLLAQDYESAKQILHQEGVVVMGGVAPGQTTDAVGAALAEYTDADLLIYATSVDGVYDSDPKLNPKATRYDELSPGELVEIISSMEMIAGTPAPVDLLASKLIERSCIKTVVIDGSDPKNVINAVLHGKYNGTIINSDMK